jgi:hypothetical protein
VIPAATAQAPAPGATNVATNATAAATFNEAVQAGTVSFVLKDAGNNVVPASLSYNGTTFTATLTPSAPLANSTTYTATVSGATDANGHTMTSPVTWSFTTVAGIGSTSYSIWGSSDAPTVAADSDGNSTELGVKFRSDVAGYVTGIRFYKGSANTGTHTGSLWTSTGTLLATATFTNETATGWQQVNFSTPVPIVANITYVASYHAPGGHYAGDNNYFASGGVDSGPLHALANGVDGPDGVYAYASTSTFPTSTYLSSNYWVDVAFSTDSRTWLQTSAADFGTGTQNNTAVGSTFGGGEQLAYTFSDDFTGTSLGSAWTSKSLSSAASVTVANGVLSVLAAEVLSVPTTTTGGVEASVTIGAAASEYFGLATDLAAAKGNYWAVFTTRTTTTTLYAEVNVNGTLTDTSLGALPAGFHVYRVQPIATGFQFYVDGILKTTISKTFPSGTALKVALSATNGAPKPALQADWVHLLSYASSGTFTSSVFDAGRVATWGTASWAASLPAGTTITVQTRSGNTTTPDDGTWSAWTTATNGGALASPPGRYLQYRVILTSSDPTKTPVLFDISFTWS